MKILRVLLLLYVTSGSAIADLPNETYGQLTLENLPEHTLLVNTFSARAMIFDADTQKMLGMISTGIGANAFEINRASGLLRTAETYLTRHTRGERTDVVSTYDISNLAPVSEVVIPPKHASGSPHRYYTGILNDSDSSFMLVTNITPAVSISVVDLASGEFKGEIGVAGCGMIYPNAGLSFLQLCGDGAAQLVTLDENGTEISRVRSESFFDLQADPLMEKPVRTDDGWIFNTFKGQLFLLSTRAGEINVEELFQISADEPDWRIGGMQPLAYHAPSNLLLALMHQGDEDTHKDPGTEVWYFDLERMTQVHRLTLNTPSNSIQVSQDSSPRLYAGSIGADQVEVYDLKTTESLGVIDDIGLPTILQNF